jgi:4-methyl-5(b-hydroxyethyl)-thiazole monophosphate biosynthesis
MKWGLRYLANGFEAYEASVFTDVLGWKRVFGDIPVEVTAGGRRRKLKCTWNFTVIPETKVDQVNPKDSNALAIPGGFEKAGFYEDSYHEDSMRTPIMRILLN